MEKYGLLFESIFKRKLTDEDAAGYLKNITKEHPYFSVAQFYLLRLSQKNVNGYKNQARKTAVLFNNNHWLNFQLLEAGFDNNTGAERVTTALSFPEKIADDVYASTTSTIGNDETSAETFSSVQPRYDAVVEDIQATDIAKETAIEEEIKAEESGVEEPIVINDPLIVGEANAVEEVINEEAEAMPIEEQSAVLKEDVNIEEEIKAEESGAEEPVLINDPLVVGEDNTIDEVVNDETANAAYEKNEAAATMEEIALKEEIKAEEGGTEEPVVINEPLIVGENNTVDEVVAGDTATLDEEIKTVETATEDNHITIEEVIEDEPKTTAEGITAESPVENNELIAAGEHVAAAEQNAVIEDPSTGAIPNAGEEKKTEQVIAEKSVEPEPLLFEPLHTSDYFASVGIKLSEEEKTAGNLGKQLKSFTDWLKTMKKVHAEQLKKTSSPAEVNLSATESTIQKMAEKSNQENDVITEAMSDVLLQQGKADKAIEILEKLSLLNPGKSAYFAAKINQIKDK